MSEPIKVDTHVHLSHSTLEAIHARCAYQVWEYGRQEEVKIIWLIGTLDELLESMHASGMDHAILVNLFVAKRHRDHFIEHLPATMANSERLSAIQAIDAAIPKQMMEYNRWVCRIAREHPSLKACVSADVTILPSEAGAEHLRDMVENEGARGIKLHGTSQGFSIADKRLWPIYDVCREFGIPVVGHAGPDRDGHGFTEPRTFANILKSFPEMPVVLAHLGGGSWQQVRELTEHYSNVYFDCSEIIEWTHSEHGPSDKQLAQLIKDVGHERVMMGSDWPWYDMKHTIERVMELPLLSLEEKEAILGANAMRIFKLD